MTGYSSIKPIGRLIRYTALAAAIVACGWLQGCSQSDQRMRQLSDHKPPAGHIPGTTGHATGETPGQNVGNVPGGQTHQGTIRQMAEGGATAVDRAHAVEGIAIGDTEGFLVTKWGKPTRIIPSEYGFPWYIYTNMQKYDHYFQAGIRDGRIYALYTNTDHWAGLNGISQKSTKDQIRQVYHKFPKTQDNATAMTFTADKTNATYYFDNLNNSTVLGVLFLDSTISDAVRVKAASQAPTDDVRAGFERQLFDLTNAARVRYGSTRLTWDDKAAYTASVHSQDMAARGYFDHINTQGQSSFDRMQQAGINYQVAAENISAGQPNAIEAFTMMMNSGPHRQNLFSNADRLGTGVAVGGPMRIYYTQHFYKYR